MIHKFNIYTHVLVGCLALMLGLVILVRRKGTLWHRKQGILFVRLMVVVIATAFAGWLFFRSNAFLLMLTLLAGYNTYSGFRSVKLKDRMMSWRDVSVAGTVLATGFGYTVWLMQSDTIWSPSVIYSTLSGLVLVTVYDLIKRFVFFDALKGCWLYEHIYKITSGWGALLSAFAGTVLPDWTRPYSQIVPGAICLLIIVVFIIFEARKKKPIVQQPLIS